MLSPLLMAEEQTLFTGEEVGVDGALRFTEEGAVEGAGGSFFGRDAVGWGGEGGWSTC
jgi:hypothetical protein